MGRAAAYRWLRGPAHCFSCGNGENQPPDSSRHWMKVRGNVRDKNDPKDAQVILHMLKIGAVQPFHDPLRAGINDIQELSKTHEAISRAKTEIQHRILTHYLPLYFPEVERFRGNTRSDWFFVCLGSFPTPASITSLGKEG